MTCAWCYQMQLWKEGVSVARNERGEVMAAATSHLVACLSSLLAEAATFKWSLRLAMELGFRRVCFETLFIFVSMVEEGLAGCSYLDSIIRDCSSFFFLLLFLLILSSLRVWVIHRLISYPGTLLPTPIRCG